MKKTLKSFSILLFVAVVLVSCTKNTPKDVAQQWLTDFFHLDYDAAKKLSTEDTKKLLDQVATLSTQMPDSTRQLYRNISITIKTVTVTGDKASIVYTGSDNPTLEQPLNLVKTDGKWLVLYTKDDQPEPSSANTISSEPATTVTDSARLEAADTTAVLESDKSK